MKVVCVDNDDGWEDLTIGKTYDVIEEDDDGDYIIINDNNHKDWYHKEWFKPLSEYRIEKINKLLEDESSLLT